MIGKIEYVLAKHAIIEQIYSYHWSAISYVAHIICSYMGKEFDLPLICHLISVSETNNSLWLHNEVA